MGAAAALAHSQSDAGVVREVQPGGAPSSAWPRLERGRGVSRSAILAHSRSEAGVVREVQPSGAAFYLKKDNHNQYSKIMLFKVNTVMLSYRHFMGVSAKLGAAKRGGILYNFPIYGHYI